MEITDMINRAIEGRFIVRFEGFEIKTLMSLADPALQNVEVLQLQRKTTSAKGWRTLAICSITSHNDIQLALQWSAECKEELLDPESADLYLLMLTQGFDLSKEECLSIEASEKFCRKLILRPSETLDKFLARTFLVPISENAESKNIMDPLTLALKDTKNNSAWFDDIQQNIWRKALLNSQTGQDLIDHLFTDTDQQA